MSPLLVLFDERCLDFDTGSGFFELQPSPLLAVPEKHPENGDRLRNVVSVLKRGPLGESIEWRTPRAALVSDLATVHSAEHIAQLEADGAGRRYGASTVLPPGGFLGVSLAAGAALDACEAILRGEAKLSFALVRPPGHHAAATPDGYCFCNNIALAAERASRGGHRVAIIDVDVHHGNGTQTVFYSRADVLTCSMHQDMGAWDEGTAHTETGGTEEVGAGAGIGFNVNVPLFLGAGDIAHAEAFRHLIVPEVNAFQPTLIMVALGVDGSQADPNGRQCLTTAGYFALGREVKALADAHAEGRILATMEGGYALSYAAFCVDAFLEGCLGHDVLRLQDPAGKTYPDPPRRDSENEQLATLLPQLKKERSEAIALARTQLA